MLLQTSISYRRSATWGRPGSAGRPTTRNISPFNWTTRPWHGRFRQRFSIRLTNLPLTWFGAGTRAVHRGSMAAKEQPENPQPNYRGLQDRRLIPGTKVYGKTGCTSLSRTSVWRGVREGWFPSPVSVSPGRVAWFEDEVSSWLASRPRLRSTADVDTQRDRLLPPSPAQRS